MKKMLAPYVFGLLLLVFLPAGITFGLAFTEFDLIQAPEWIGTANFSELTRDDAFHAALQNSLWFALIAIPLRLLLALGLALLLTPRAPLVGTARTSVVLPTAVPELAYGLLWLWLFNPFYGPINQVIQAFGGMPRRWLTDPADAQAAIIIMSLFTMGESFVILLAARQALPRELYELAALEDATWWDIFRRITFPMLAPVLVLLLIRDTILSLQISFVPALVVTEGGPPPYGTTYLSLFVYRNAFEYLRYGYAAAATLVMLGLTGVAVLLQWRLIRLAGTRAAIAPATTATSR